MYNLCRSLVRSVVSDLTHHRGQLNNNRHRSTSDYWKMAYNDSVIIISSDSESESDCTSGSITPDRIVTRTGRVIMPVSDENVDCYNYILDFLTYNFNEAIKWHKYDPERYTFQFFCKTVSMLADYREKEEDLHDCFTYQDRQIHNHLSIILTAAMDAETASCDAFSAKRKLSLFCRKVNEVISGTGMTNM